MKIIITSGRDCWSVEWINIYILFLYSRILQVLSCPNPKKFVQHFNVIKVQAIVVISYFMPHGRKRPGDDVEYSVHPSAYERLVIVVRGIGCKTLSL